MIPTKPHYPGGLRGMNYQSLQHQIDLQAEWANDLARQRSTDNREPSNSLRHLLMGDDHRSEEN
jgi:hypothetical protein